MGIPQIIIVVFFAMSFGVALIKHGEIEEKKYNAGMYIVDLIIIFGCLIWGGFFG